MLNVFAMNNFWIVKEPDIATPGGVNLEPAVIQTLGNQIDIKTTLSDLVSIAEQAKTGDVIFVQQEGSLSLNYNRLVSQILANGAIVVEKNVFALPSKFRPIHQNYRMALMSQDGAYRYKIRSSIARLQTEKNFYILPNPNLLEDVPVNTEFWPYTNNQFSILRVGRPDIRKWTNFELNFAKKLARQLPGNEIVLQLLGAPDELDTSNKIPNLEIRKVPYTRELNSYYENSDLYLHHSAIGETFGNTIFEAKSFSLPIVLGIDLAWDMAPIEYLGKNIYSHFVNNILENPTLAIAKAYFARISQNQEEYFNLDQEYQNQKSRNKIVALLQRDFKSLEKEMPTTFESIKYLERINKNYGGSRANLILPLAKEIYRTRKRLFLDEN